MSKVILLFVYYVLYIKFAIYFQSRYPIKNSEIDMRKMRPD